MYVKEHSNRKNYSSLHLNLSRLLKWMAGKHKMKKYILHFSSWNEIIIQSNCYFWVVFGLFGFGFFFFYFFSFLLLFGSPLQVYEVKQGSSVVEKIRMFIHKVTAPLHPKVDTSRAQCQKPLSHPFSREKQHL